MDKALFVTSRQREIAFLKCQGLTATEIANRLEISSRTVEHHLSHVYQCLGVAGHVELATWLFRNPEILRVRKSKPRRACNQDVRRLKSQRLVRFFAGE